MNHTQAIAKLKPIIGKTFAYRVDPKAPDADERKRLRAEFVASGDNWSEIVEKVCNSGGTR